MFLHMMKTTAAAIKLYSITTGKRYGAASETMVPMNELVLHVTFGEIGLAGLTVVAAVGISGAPPAK